MWGMKDCRPLVLVGTYDRVFPVVHEPLAWLGTPLLGWSLVPPRGLPTTKSDEKCVLRMGG
jgi:hypothetical protein